MMIQISSKDTLYMYNLYHIVKAFFPNEEISQNLDEKQESLVSVKLEENSCFYVPVSEIADCPDCQDGKKKVTKLVFCHFLFFLYIVKIMTVHEAIRSSSRKNLL